MTVPTAFWSMTFRMIHDVLPEAHFFLKGWIEEARKIPDPELRKQALMSIANKTFHCEGGALFGLLAGSRRKEAIRFIIAYQTISDYLDNLCDRSTSQDPVDFRALHESMFHALTPGVPCAPYYRFRKEQDDGGYLARLVTTCQEVLAQCPAYLKIAPTLYELAGYYCDLQVFKHVRVEERVPNLKSWFEKHKPDLPDMSWFEFSACAGSTLGIFCLASRAQDPGLNDFHVQRIRDAYFPWVQGLHILMDYTIDQEEDRLGGDLNFCAYYENDEQMAKRLTLFLQNANDSVSHLPDAGFHRMICRGLPALYLADKKVSKQNRLKKIARKVIHAGGPLTQFFYWHCLVYRRVSNFELRASSSTG